MSKITLAVCAGIGAVTGAAATAALYNSRKPSYTTIPTQQSTAIPAPPPQAATYPPRSSTTNPYPPSPAPISVPVPTQPTPYSATQPPPPVNPSGISAYGFPGPIADLNQTPSLTSSYDRRTKNPHWVAEHITPFSLSQQNGDRKHSQFVEDARIPAKFQGKLKDYFRSGYDRGHQVPAADCKWSQEAMDATFALSNMCPQVGEGFNRDYWAHFEDFCRRLTGQYPSVRIVTGPLYLPKRDPVDNKWRISYEVIGNPPNIAVPTHFYKIILGEDALAARNPLNPEGKIALAAFVLPNARIDNSKPLADFEVPIEAVERAAGLEFVGKLPEGRRKRLCQEVACSIIVKEYKERQKSIAGMGKGQQRN